MKKELESKKSNKDVFNAMNYLGNPYEYQNTKYRVECASIGFWKDFVWKFHSDHHRLQDAEFVERYLRLVKKKRVRIQEITTKIVG